MPRRTPSAPADITAPDSAAQGGLIYVCDDEPGLRRQRVGRGFRYIDARGKAVRDPATLERIRALAIPPAYRDVWICARAHGHLQATGRDARGRKQYRYHPRWKQVRDAEKFDRIVAFGAAPPRLRRRVRRDLAQPGLPRTKVLAVVIAIMTDTLLRIGNSEYARGNRSYGLTTLRNRHVEFLRGGRARLRFRGKGGVEQQVLLDDARLTHVVRRCQQLPGQSLFQYVDDDGVIQPVDSGQVNDYLQEAMGAALTAKDFRTWGGTLLALQLLAAEPVAEVAAQSGAKTSKRARERHLASVRTRVIAEVASALRNTPAVCRKSYVDPGLLQQWEQGALPPGDGGRSRPAAMGAGLAAHLEAGPSSPITRPALSTYISC